MDCLFCRFVSGEQHCHKIWEDEKHIAFLTIFPNTEGATVVMPKEHHSSYAFDLNDEVLMGLILAAKKVGQLLDQTFPDVGRTAMVLEGFGINHVHAKLFPLHGTNFSNWKPINSSVSKVFDQYEGYISSHDGPQVPEETLKKVAEKIVSKKDGKST